MPGQLPWKQRVSGMFLKGDIFTAYHVPYTCAIPVPIIPDGYPYSKDIFSSSVQPTGSTSAYDVILSSGDISFTVM